VKLTNKRVLITGATGGIGAAAASLLKAEGCELLLQGHSKTSDPLGNFISVDLTTAEGRDQLIKAAIEFDIDVLINNCGVNQFCFFEQADVEHIMAVNVIAPMLITQSLLPHLKSKQNSAVLNVGSTFGEIGFPGYVAYCASKAALKGFSESLRRELADTKVRVMHLSPRAVRTDMNSAKVDALNEALGNGVDEPSVLAEEIVRQLSKECLRSQVGFLEKLQVKLNHLFPSVVDRALGGQLATIKNYLQ
jgi:short-subunit dehydrogenase